MEREPLLRIDAAAKRLGIGRSKAYQLARVGELPGLVRIGGSLRVDPASLDRWIERTASESAGEVA
jgi:excisionase family DNA binding protein